MNGYCMHSHPFLDPRIIRFAFEVPPHIHFDYLKLDRRNPYAVSKMLARDAYVDHLPAFIYGKTHKTSYALMARQIFQNSAPTLYHIAEQPMVLHELQLVDQEIFRRHVLAYILATEDPNANLGINYHFIRGVVDLEVWLRRFSGSRERIVDQLRFRPLPCQP
jgi:asparagine synthase (glutamine-hydrolysing)